MTSVGTSSISVFGAIWKHRWLVASSVIIGAIAGAILGTLLARSPLSEASASLVVSETGEFTAGGADQPERFVANQVEIIRSVRVADRTVEILISDGFDGVEREDLLDELRVGADDESDEIVLRYANEDPELAVATVNAVLQAYRETNREQTEATAQVALGSIEAELEVLDERLGALETEIADLQDLSPGVTAITEQAMEALAAIPLLQDQLSEAESEADRIDIQTELDAMQGRVALFLTVRDAVLADPELDAAIQSQTRAIARRAALIERRDQILIDSALTPGFIAFEDPAIFSSEIPGISGARSLAIGLILGLLVGATLAILKVSRADAGTNRQDVQLILGAPLLGIIPKFDSGTATSSVPVRDKPTSAPAEAFRFVAYSMETVLARSKNKIVLVVSPSTGDGKSVTAANTALAAALRGRNVLAIDGDFGSQSLGRLLNRSKLNAADRAGLTDLVIESGKLLDGTWEADSTHGSLKVLSRGQEVHLPSDVLDSPHAKELMKEARRHFDLVLVDSPAILDVAYSTSLLDLVDTVIAVVPRRSEPDQIVKLKERCDFVERPITGFIYVDESTDAIKGPLEESKKGVFEVTGGAHEATPTKTGA